MRNDCIDFACRHSWLRVCLGGTKCAPLELPELRFCLGSSAKRLTSLRPEKDACTYVCMYVCMYVRTLVQLELVSMASHPGLLRGDSFEVRGIKLDHPQRIVDLARLLLQATPLCGNAVQVWQKGLRSYIHAKPIAAAELQETWRQR